jgi:2-amino-4-hydroxy-6-hydroxymethyldihydropteridine diphosphokinase
MTEPVDFTDQEWFLNAVISVDTALAPLDLLRELKSIEKASGRDYDIVRFGPRTLDLDIIFYDDLVMSSRELTIPHPRMHERRFVLKPLCDIDADLVHPMRNRRVDALLDELAEDGQRIVPI